MPGTVIRIETELRTKGGPRYTRVLRCEGCHTATVRRRGKTAKPNEARHLCQSCVHQKRPYESLYNGLFNDHRRIPVDLTYEEYVEFTKQTTCTYCADQIPWVPYGTVNGKFKSRAYFLDRRDHSKSYSKNNCVVCCTFCNRLRSTDFSYEEFLLIGKVLKKIRKARKGGTCGS